MSDLTVSQTGFFTLLVGALRYALGRRSYVVGNTADIVRHHFRDLTENQREVILTDLRRHVDESPALDRTEPRDIRETWRQLLRDLDAA